MSTAADGFRTRARAAMAAGQPARAAALLGEALAAVPNDAMLWNSAGNASLGAGDARQAADRFAMARSLMPGSFEYALNHAIALGRAGNHGGAITILRDWEDAGERDVRYCSARANASRQAGLMNEAARWYDKGLALDTGHGRCRHGRARVAIERGEADALEHFERALAQNPRDPDLWLGKAQALEVAGRVDEAREIAQALVVQAPQWLDALHFMAQLLLAAGDADFAAPYREAARLAPEDPAIARAHCKALAGLEKYAEAADVAAAADRRFPASEGFAMLEAIHAGEAGQDERAEAIWATYDRSTPGRALHEARQRIRQGRPDAADELLDRALAEDPWAIGAWALRGLVWRVLGDARAEWLHGREGMVSRIALNEAEDILPALVPLLDELHDGSPFPLGQSLRGGTQTRGNLFHRADPQFARLADAIGVALERYRDGLPPSDDAHPLLRHRAAAWRLKGSWSVRLSGGGDFHTAHIHPQGVVSSALYVIVPPVPEDDPQAGWLELGRPPPDLRLDLPPLATIEPEPGVLALFPSTLYHGTRPFPAARRMTVAFDVALADEYLE